MANATTCTNHCSCGQHFHSLEAFDLHRQGDYASDDPEFGRHCVHPFDLDGRLVALTDDGVCRLTGDDTLRGVLIWTTKRQRGTRPWDRAPEPLTAFASMGEEVSWREKEAA